MNYKSSRFEPRHQRDWSHYISILAIGNHWPGAETWYLDPGHHHSLLHALKSTLYHHKHKLSHKRSTPRQTKIKTEHSLIENSLKIQEHLEAILMPIKQFHLIMIWVKANGHKLRLSENYLKKLLSSKTSQILKKTIQIFVTTMSFFDAPKSSFEYLKPRIAVIENWGARMFDNPPQSVGHPPPPPPYGHKYLHMTNYCCGMAVVEIGIKYSYGNWQQFNILFLWRQGNYFDLEALLTMFD